MDKIISDTYDEKSGVSTVMLWTRWGTFTRSVSVADEDKDIANRWDGRKFAYYKCEIAKLKAKGRALIERSRGISHAANVIAQTMGASSSDVDDELARALDLMERQARVAKRDGRRFIELAENMEDAFPHIVENAQAARRGFREFREKTCHERSMGGKKPSGND